MRLTALVLQLSIAIPSAALAQASVIEGLLKNASDVNIFYQFVHTKSGDLATVARNGARGLGFELSFSAGSVPRGRSPSRLAVRDTICDQFRDSLQARGNAATIREADSLRKLQREADALHAVQQPLPPVRVARLFKTLDSLRALDTAYIRQVKENHRRLGCVDTPKKLTHTDVQLGDTTLKYEVTPSADDGKALMSFEVAVGYSQAGGYRSARGPDSTLRTSVRELPSITVYATLLPDDLPLSPYFGARSGILTLHSGRAYTDGAVHTLQGQTFQFGLVGGVVGGLPKTSLSVFVEGTHNWRSFPSVEWSAAPAGPIPGAEKGYPRSIRLNGWSLAIGAQIELADHKGK